VGFVSQQIKDQLARAGHAVIIAAQAIGEFRKITAMMRVARHD
tara:strand:+ start:89 stop:217 length:129 start_codon:yes stop_codon:yes gene_type:complete